MHPVAKLSPIENSMHHFYVFAVTFHYGAGGGPYGEGLILILEFSVPTK